jgi:hypothetical protein
MKKHSGILEIVETGPGGSTLCMKLPVDDSPPRLLA